FPVFWRPPSSTLFPYTTLFRSHVRGLTFVLDVVYNHFGPEGNYVGEFAPYFTSKYATPWGDAIDYEGAPAARQLVLENARMWFEDRKSTRLNSSHVKISYAVFC